MLDAFAEVLDNPVLVKEMRTRMRGARAYWLMFLYLMLLSIVLFVGYFMWYQSHVRGGLAPTTGGDPVGRILFRTLFITQAVLVLLITPALTAGLLTIEREQRTMDLLLLTLLRPKQIVGGKLMSALGFVLLLLTASLPLAGICFLLGGVSHWEVLAVYVLIALGAFAAGAVGMLFSAAVNSTSLATSGTYLVGLCAFVATAMLAIGGMVRGGAMGPLAALNPVFAAYNALAPVPFYRWSLPAWVPATAANLLVGLMAGRSAMHHMEEGSQRHAAELRWLAYISFIAAMVAAGGTVLSTVGVGAIPSTQSSAVSVLAGCLLSLLVLYAIVFCTADADEVNGTVRRRPQHGGTRLSRLIQIRPFSGGYRSAPVYLVLLFLTGAAVILGGFATAPTNLAGAGGTLGAALVVVAGVTAFYAAVARFYSAAIGSRYAAAALVFVTATAFSVLPLLNLIGYDPSIRPPHQLLWETLYLCPGFPLASLAMNARDWSVTMPPVLAGQTLVWLITAALHVAGAGALELFGQAILAARRSRRQGTTPGP